MTETTLWLAIVAIAGASFTLKAVGPALVGERQFPPRAQGVIALLAPVLLTALVVVEIFGHRWHAVSWPVLVGLAVAAGARLLKMPALVAVALGVIATALLRLIS